MWLFECAAVYSLSNGRMSFALLALYLLLECCLYVCNDAPLQAVRSTHGLEVPLSCHGKLLVDEDYIQFLTQIANQKMEENLRRVQRLAFWSLQENQHHLMWAHVRLFQCVCSRFFQNLQSAMSAERQHISDTLGTQEHQDSQHTHKKGRRGEQGTNKQNEINLNKRRPQHETDSCHGYEDSSLPELDDCLDLFT